MSFRISLRLFIFCFCLVKINARCIAPLKYRNQKEGISLFKTNDDCCVDYCYTTDEQPYTGFASKTAYQINNERSLHKFNIPGCTPVQFWTLNRHGTRYPGPDNIIELKVLQEIHAQIISNYDEHHSYPEKGSLCSSDLELFRGWKWDESIDDKGNELTTQGTKELKYLASTFAARLGDFLAQPYSEDYYYFRHTSTNRTRESFQGYASGLFGDDISQVQSDVFEEDLLLKPTDFCQAWIDGVDENPETKKEYKAFRKSAAYVQMLEDVFTRLGYNETLDKSVVDNMYDMCRYEKAWYVDQPSPWCVVFNEDQLEMLEYAEDLKYYYNDGYGNQLNAMVGCPPVKDFYERFERRVNGDTSGPRVTAYFTHSDTIQTFLAAMGIGKGDEPLTADNFELQKERQWRISKLGPFGSNVVAILHECQTDDPYRVSFYVNEQPVNYPGCSEGICSWSTVKDLLGSVAQNCNLDFCNQTLSSIS